MPQFAEAEAEIRQLYARYTDTVWRKDPIAFGDCFTPDAEWRIAGMVLQGRDPIAEAFAGIAASAVRILMTFRTPLLEVAGAAASGRVYVTEQCAWTDRAPHATIGCYHDRYLQDDGCWRFSWRLFELHYMGPPDLTGAFHDRPDYGTWPAMPPLDALAGAA